MQLAAFRRIALKPGEKKKVDFDVTPDMLSMLNVDMHRVVEPGVFELMVGPSSDQTTTVPLTVIGIHGESGKTLPPPPPAGSESGVVSTFDDGKVAANFGRWIASSDAMSGGKSTIAMKIVEPGANNSKGALQADGEIIPGAQFAWAGLMFAPASSLDEPANLSTKTNISFWAKGDGKTYTLAVMTAANEGQMPAIKPFAAGSEWKQFSFPIASFASDGSDLTGVVFGRAQEPGKFEFEIDQVEIK
jgi:hypothetical protein